MTTSSCRPSGLPSTTLPELDPQQPVVLGVHADFDLTVNCRNNAGVAREVLKKYKGQLEDLDDATIDQQLYVGISRARSHCVIVVPERR